ncbi:MAG: metalloregulator ArsR/SmtB family transcription factor [Rhodobacter sp.]|uniref:metalloregulator ArsR/SmtB family transcription factor n=1 Tax=Pararhodobacter sp. TaxID=2127056 RepID=UPI001D90BE70|nr:metalloregulator ArsR/SmtB family transcription factor [Pararhodobacter sp.]MCB1346718.1 metalloregulator ArsR/SmtB family transcription factor [Paracoccaceae bacterium]MCC0074453.1 metalloregulator ArsR/SmtB family transcription factor [Rhodobacter sp.]HPD93175.1 metalloregulator ArsR/SmtB family transcription factor [Pararhodobacter sp.]
MEQSDAAQAFATLGHPDRLAVYRLLMRFAPRGARPTEIAAALGFKPNTLSHHLADLTSAGMLRVERRGRSLHYSIALDRAEGLIGYLALDVGRGRPDLMPGLSAPLMPEVRPPSDAPRHVLFLCTANSARSLFAEALLRDLGQGRFVAHSAGTRPGPGPNPMAIEVLRRNEHDVSGLASKSILGFQAPGAPRMDFVFTVCDTAAAEDCPPWPGQPITGHWGLPDPVSAPGTEAERALAFAQTYAALRRRIAAFVALPLDRLDRLAVQSRVDAISKD